jgi:hypothetical protein
LRVGAGRTDCDLIHQWQMCTFLDLRCASGIVSVDVDGHLSGFKPQRPGDNDVASFMNCGAIFILAFHAAA